MGKNRDIGDNFIKRQICRPLAMVMASCLVVAMVGGCGLRKEAGEVKPDKSGTSESGSETEYVARDFHPEDGYIRESEDVKSSGTDNTNENAENADNVENSDNAAENSGEENSFNTEFSLSVPTYVTKIDNMWFIVDCYHDQIIYSENMGAPLNEWRVLTKAAKQPHTIAGDGEVLLVDDTENNRVLVFEKNGDGYVNTQLFSDIGKRPHYTIYDEKDKAFYVWSSTTGEMYIFRHEEGSSKMYLTDIRNAGTNDTYIRSFYTDGDDIYFVSGICADGNSSGIIVCDKHTFEMKEKIEVPNELAGMVALRKDGEYYYLTISTDITGSQDAATMIRTRDIHSLINGDYEEIYSTYFVGGGTPYNITEVDGILYLTEHRVPGHSVWSYRIENDEITDVQAIY